jgi:WD40 repeat protein
LKETEELESSKASISALAFSPDGKYLAVGDVSDIDILSLLLTHTYSCKSSGKIILHDVVKREVRYYVHFLMNLL